MRKPKSTSAPSLTTLQPNAAGADIGAREIYVAVPPDRSPAPVRCFGTFTDQLRALVGLRVEPGRPAQVDRRRRGRGESRRQQERDDHDGVRGAGVTVTDAPFLPRYWICRASRALNRANQRPVVASACRLNDVPMR